VRERRLRDLLAGSPPTDRIFWGGLWFRSHNNGRYAELLPRLERLDAYRLTCSGRRVARGLQYRAYRSPAGSAAQRVLLPRAARLYRGMLATEWRQVGAFPGPAVVDVDDPFFFEPALSAFRRPNVVALVTLADWAAERFRGLGVTAPIHVIPQGVSFRGLTDEALAAARARRRPDEIVVGYQSALLASGEDAEVDPLYNVDHLLRLWAEVHAAAPEARLWLVGEPTEHLRRRLAGNRDVLLTGRVPRAEVLATTACFDVGLYPRLKPDGIQAAKVAEYLGAGVPTVAYDYPVVDVLRETGAGVLASSPRDFVGAVLALVRNVDERRRLAAVARAAGAGLDWDVLARRYEAEVLDRYLPAER
jgi:glycosyltransferase involved in cell wall biosynthesis